MNAPSKLLEISAAILASEIIVIAILIASSVASVDLLHADKNTYDNQYGRSFLLAQIPDTISFDDGSNAQTMKTDLLTLDSRSPAKFSSLPNYFYSQIKTAHPWTNYGFGDRVKGLSVNEAGLGSFILELSSKINQMPQDAVLQIEDNRATKFVPHKLGKTLDLAKTHALTKVALFGVEPAGVILPTKTTEPRIMLSDLNVRGIRELVARGQSDFHGSSPARINNIRVGASQYNGVIIKQNEEFSFNKYLGQVDARSGYLPELVIKPEGLAPEYGGGLCQVSTTAFRAAFFGGMPITARRNHSYAVNYYRWIDDDLPVVHGLDATIYAPYQDMKFINDTPGDILIWTRMEGTKLYFDFYGTPDERLVAVDGPHEYDRRASGAVKATVKRTITINGEINESVFNSSYVPPKTLPESFEN
jgi:vancomycin resistance protein YoaR